MKQLYFIRHGLSQANVDKIWGGHTDSLLTDEGKSQAAAAGEKLKEQRIAIDLIIASPLLRTQETARIIAERIGYPVEQILTEKLIMERSFGKEDGQSIEKFFEDKVYKDMDSVEEVETIEQLQFRATEALEALKVRPEENILIVSHGAFGRAIRRAAKGEPYTNEYIIDWAKNQISNAQIIQLV